MPAYLGGCAKRPAHKPEGALEDNPIFKNAFKLVNDQTLSIEKNPLLARSLQDFYMLKGCVGVGYGESAEIASNKSSAAYKESKCQAGEPAKTIRFKAYNGTFYCIMTTNPLSNSIMPEQNNP